MSSGQICMAAKRFYVHESRFDDVVDGFSAFASRQDLGDGTHDGVTMDPVNNEEQIDNVTSFIDEAKQAGADVCELGSIDDRSDFEAGYFIKPTMVIAPDPGLKIVKDEQCDVFYGRNPDPRPAPVRASYAETAPPSGADA